MVAASKAGRFAETGADCGDALRETSARAQERRRVGVALGILYFLPGEMVNAG